MAKGNRFTLGTWLLGALTENIGLKAFSLVIAVVLFSFYGGIGGADGATVSQRTFFVDVTQTIPRDDDVLVSEFPRQIRVTLEGSGYLLSSIDVRELWASINLTNPEERFYYFSPDDIQGKPNGVTVADIQPSVAGPLQWDARAERTVPVRVRLSGTLPEGLQLLDPLVVQPGEVKVEGAEASVPVGGVWTEALDVSELPLGRHERRLQLEPPPKHVRYVSGMPEVDVTLEVVPEVRKRTFAGLEVVAVGPSGRVRPRRVDVQVQGSPSQVDALSPDVVVPWVDATDENLDGTSPQPVQVRGVPDGVTIVSIEPAEVFLTIGNRQ